jgi:thiopurine S-methyltransferase
MNPEFWHKRWQNKQIGFNQSDVSPSLIEYFPTLNVRVGGRVFVPLCGKSIDMVWLASQGYDVVGVELVESAVQAFFSEHNILPKVHQYSDNPVIKYYQGQMSDQTVTLWVNDIFALTPKDIGQIDAVYDRAALIALPPEMRPKYGTHVRQLSSNANIGGHAPQLLVTLNYDQNKKSGPPFSISNEQIQQYYSGFYQITELENTTSNLRSAPEVAVSEHVWLLSN